MALHGALHQWLLAYTRQTMSRGLRSSHGSKEDSPSSWWQQGVVDQLAAVATTINMERLAFLFLTLFPI